MSALCASALILVGACGSPSGSSPITATPTPPAAAGASPTAASPATTLRAACLPLPHEAPDLEAALPRVVAGREIATWSVHGELLVRCIQGGSDADVAAFETAAIQDGMTLDDLSVAIGGRSDVQGDPPYFILAYGLKGHPATDLPDAVGLDHPDLGTWQEATFGGKTVLVGDQAMVDQTEHARGRPYVWNSPTVHYLVVTDSEAWAAEVLGALQ